MSGPRPTPLSGIACMLFAVASFSLMDAALKLLTAHYPPMQVAALRGLAALPIIATWVVASGAWRELLAVRWSLHLLRAALSIFMLWAFAYALKRLPLATAYSIFFVAPLLITALSVPLLGERVERPRWIAIAVGLGGVLIVLRPSGEGFLSLAGLAVLCAALGYAASAITVRILSRSDSTAMMVFWLTALLAAGASALAAPEWVPVRTEHGWVLLALAVTGALGQYAITEAFRRGEASIIAPFEYTALPWAIGLDWTLWSTVPDHYTLLGAGIIIASGIYLMRHESVYVEAERR